MKYSEDYINQIILGNAFYELPKLPSESVNCVVTSPPYWGLRDYGAEPAIWDEDKNCEHDWGNKLIILKHKSGGINPGKEGWFKDKGASNDKGSNFCQKCGAWRGNLGLEPSSDLYIKHLCDIFDKVKRVLKKDGTCWVVIGDSYASNGGEQGAQTQIPHNPEKEGYHRNEPCKQATILTKPKTNLPSKSLCDIPYRFSIEMINRGWIKRNTLIWWKPNCMPQSTKDRFTIDFEYLFYFVKSNKTLFWTNEKTGNCVGKQPLGTKGIEGIDWEWIPCSRCQGTSGETKIDEKGAEQIGSPRARYYRITKQENCKRCKGLGKVKFSLWTGHDYWFETQYESMVEGSDAKYRARIRANKQYNSKEPYRSNTPYATNKISKEIRLSAGENANRAFGDNESLEGMLDRGRNKRCVWAIPTKPFLGAHFAAYPERLIEIPIKAGCPKFICKKCGIARVGIIKKGKIVCTGGSDSGKRSKDMSGKIQGRKFVQRENLEVGYTDCGCGAGFEGGIVLDPFIGSGTTAKVALKQGKRFIGFDVKREYVEMARKEIAKIQLKLF